MTLLLWASRSAASPLTLPCRWVLAPALHGTGSSLRSTAGWRGGLRADSQITQTSGPVKPAHRDRGAHCRVPWTGREQLCDCFVTPFTLKAVRSPRCRGLRKARWHRFHQPLAAWAGKPRLKLLAVPAHCIPVSLSSLQNVLLQMGLHVLAVNGMLIRQARSYILRCHGCFK